MRSRLKPIHLLWFIVISNIGVTAVAVLMAAQSWHLRSDQRLPANVRRIDISIIVIFLVVVFAGEWLFQRRLRSGAWTDEELARPRRYLSHPAVTISTFAMMILAITIVSFWPLVNGSLFFLFMCLPLSMSQLNMALGPTGTTPELFSSLPTSSLYPAKPIQSDEWGH
jgi:hypothetical protein